jgi:hypothetical protein
LLSHSDNDRARAYYEQQRSKGKGHQAATRALAFKWIRIIFKCWQTRTAYNEVKYLEGLRKKGSSFTELCGEQSGLRKKFGLTRTPQMDC